MGFTLAITTSVLILFITFSLTKSDYLNIISRRGWNASEPTSIRTLKENPPPYAVVHHSVTRICNTTDDCKALVKSIQNYHMINKGWEDIGYNFVIGGDGNIYEGRGWGIHGAHDIPYNARSLGVCLSGNFENTEPLQNQLEALQKLLTYSVEKNKLTTDYHLIGHNQSTPTLCPGKYLFGKIEEMPHFDSNPKSITVKNVN